MRLPLYAIAAFVALYVVAAALYPGGTSADATTVGYSMLHNYWCDMMDRVAYNGAPNPGFPVAMAAMFVLSIAHLSFWFVASTLFRAEDRLLCFISRITGTLSAFVSFFIFTPYHDVVVLVSGAFGLPALIVTISALARARQRKLVTIAIIPFILILVNFVVWQTGVGLSALPLIQKIAFIFVFYWMTTVTLVATRRRGARLSL